MSFFESIEKLRELEEKNNFCRGLDIRCLNVWKWKSSDSGKEIFIPTLFPMRYNLEKLGIKLGINLYRGVC